MHELTPSVMVGPATAPTAPFPRRMPPGIPAGVMRQPWGPDRIHIMPLPLRLAVRPEDKLQPDG